MAYVKKTPQINQSVVDYTTDQENRIGNEFDVTSTRIKNIEDIFYKGYIDASAGAYPKPLPTASFKPHMIVRVMWFALDGGERYRSSGRATMIYLSNGSGKIVENINDNAGQSLSIGFAADGKTVQFNNASEFFARFRYSFELIQT